MKKMMENSAKVQIDDKDLEIIKILHENARMPILTLAKKVSLSHETVRYRLNKLIKNGVIEKFTLRINKKKLGYNIPTIIMIAVWNCTESEWEDFLNYLIENKNVIEVNKVTGDFDLKIVILARDTEDSDRISHEIKTRFSKIIKNWHTFIFTQQYKWKELPF